MLRLYFVRLLAKPKLISGILTDLRCFRLVRQFLRPVLVRPSVAGSEATAAEERRVKGQGQATRYECEYRADFGSNRELFVRAQTHDGVFHADVIADGEAESDQNKETSGPVC